MEKYRDNINNALKFLLAFVKWFALAAITGAVGGLIGIGFHYSIDIVTEIRLEYPLIAFALPAAGVLIVLLYRFCHLQSDIGTNAVINSIRSDEKLPITLLPAIFIASTLSHFAGASVGREGAALQIGGTLGSNLGHLLKLDKRDIKSLTLCGMAAVFSALFGTPLAATFFVIEVINVGTILYSSLIPCIISSFTAYELAGILGVPPTSFKLDIPKADVVTGLKVILLSILCAGLSILLCITIHKTSHLLKKYFKNEYLRVIIGGVVMLMFTIIIGSQRYNGAGMNIISSAIGGKAYWYDFIIKLLLTAICIGAGFKGGEIVPTLFIGATFGCVIGPMLGLPAGFAAAISMIALFCAVINCPIASILLAMEMFGTPNILLFGIACCVSFMLSGYYGLYGAQKFECSKISFDFTEHNAE